MLFEIVLNDGESKGFYESEEDAWYEFGEMQASGVRLVQMEGDALIAEWELRDDGGIETLQDWGEL